MPMSKAAKAAMKTDLAGRFQKANAAIVAEYRGLTVGELTELRVKLREAKAEFRIVKNRIAKVSIREDSAANAPLSDALKGPIGVVFMYGDPAAATKAVLEFAKDKENFKVKAGVMESRLVPAAELKEIADLPTREVMLGQIAGMLQMPAQRILNLVLAIPRELIQVMVNHSDTKQ